MPQKLYGNTDFFGDNETGYLDAPPEPEGLVAIADPLSLDIPDKELVETVDYLIDQSRKFFKGKDLYARRKKNETYYLGRQIEQMEKEGKYKQHEVRYNDNVIFEGEATLKPIALSRLPDLLVKPSKMIARSLEAARKLTELINSDMRKRENRIVLSRAYRHRPIYFTGVIKWRWSPEINDYCFENVHPNNIDVDWSSPDNQTKNMRWVAHHYKLTAKEIVMRFPEAETEFLNKVKGEIGLEEDDKINEKGMASTYKISEVWFTWYKKDTTTGSVKWEKIEGVLWKYKDLMLKKMKNPNWDWEGERQLFSYNDKGGKTPVDENTLRQAMLQGTSLNNVKEEKVFKNYFTHPEKPFIFIGYDQLGLQPFDETSRIEQVILLQDNINKRGKQISEMADTARGKHVFSTEGGLTADDVEQIDMTDPDQDVLVKGEINKVYRHIPGQQPTAPLFQEQDMSRAKVFAKMGAHATTRGERDAKETATGRQILREADYGKQDDEVTDTINYAAEQMARAALQMIKLRYSEQKLITLMGDDGKFVFDIITNDLVEDGMEVIATASGVDLLRRKEEAFEMARLNLIDPLSFFEDIDSTNPKLRAQRLINFTASPMLYLQTFVLERTTADLANMVGSGGEVPPGGEVPQGAPPGGMSGAVPSQAVVASAQQAMNDIAMLSQGQIPPVPASVDPNYVLAINDFLNSGEFTSLTPELQQQVIAFAQQIAQLAQAQMTTQPAPEVPGAPATPTSPV
jgi:hypothetical protein